MWRSADRTALRPAGTCRESLRCLANHRRRVEPVPHATCDDVTLVVEYAGAAWSWCAAPRPLNPRASSSRAYRQTLTAQGTSLTAACANLQVTFCGPDVTGVKNLLTGEQYLRNPSTNSQLNLIVQQSTNQPLAPYGSWTVNAAGSSASLILTDSIRTVTALVSIDSATQQIVLTLGGKASSGGVQFLDWGATGFDMTIGKFITPAQGGVSLTSASFSASSNYRFYGIYWEAPLSLFQTAPRRGLKRPKSGPWNGAWPAIAASDKQAPTFTAIGTMQTSRPLRSPRETPGSIRFERSSRFKITPTQTRHWIPLQSCWFHRKLCCISSAGAHRPSTPAIPTIIGFPQRRTSSHTRTSWDSAARASTTPTGSSRE